MRFLFFILLLMGLKVSLIYPQSDSGAVWFADSSAGLKTDTLIKEPATAEGLDTVIYYGADSTEGILETSVVILKGNAWVRYKGMEIRAAKIVIDQPKRTMTAEALPDSMDEQGQALRWKGRPEFSEGGETFRGQQMEYNFETRRGKVVKGETKMQEGIYYGQVIRKIGDSTLYVRGGQFTSCEAEHPHYYFQSEQMKIEARTQVVAKPVILYIHEVPVFAIPYGVFPNQTGRRSGLVPPSYNETPREGRQLRNFGYYWAPNDYFDALTQVDYLDKAGYQFREGIRYAKRYHFTGSFLFSYSSLSYITGERSRLWSIDATHNQTIGERSNLNADIHYINNNNFYRYTSINQRQVLNRQVRSNISYTTSFDWGSISANATHAENLDNGQREWIIPNITISKSSTALFRKPEKDRDKPDTWYQTIRYSYSVNALHKSLRPLDTLATQSAMGAQHALNLTAPFKVMRYFNLTPNFSVQETWFDRRRENFRYQSDNRLTSDTARGFFARHTFNASLSASTKLYGMMNPNFLGLKTFRHVMTPTVSLNYQPDFSSRQWGYWERAADTAGRIQRFDRYGGSILFGGTPAGRILAAGFSLSNVYQAKIKTTSDTAQKNPSATERKLDLLNWNSSISYNFEAEKYKLSYLTTSLALSNDLAKNMTMALNMTHDFYRWDYARNRRTDTLNRIPRLVSASLTAGLSLQGGQNPSSEEKSEEKQQTSGSRFVPENRSLPDGVPWDLRLNFNYDISKANPKKITKQFGINITSGVKITPNWQVSYNARYDFMQKNFVSQSFSFIRDLHCWEMRLDWTPVGPTAGYFFIVQIKAQNLRDIKIQRTDYGSRTFY